MELAVEFRMLLVRDMLEHPIHRHCFVAGGEEYKQRSTSSPNCYISISPVTVKDPKSMYALSSLDGRKLFRNHYEMRMLY